MRPCPAGGPPTPRLGGAGAGGRWARVSVPSPRMPPLRWSGSGTSWAGAGVAAPATAAVASGTAPSRPGAPSSTTGACPAVTGADPGSAPGTLADGPWAVLDERGDLLAVYERHKSGTVKPSVVLAPSS